MSREELKGITKHVADEAKAVVGEATKNEPLGNEGRADQAEGNVQEAVGQRKVRHPHHCRIAERGR